MALFYFEMGGNNGDWTTTRSFLSNHSVCDWDTITTTAEDENSVTSDYLEIMTICDKTSRQITGLQFSKFFYAVSCTPNHTL